MISALFSAALALTAPPAAQANSTAAQREPAIAGPSIPTAEIDDTLEITGEDVAAKQVETRLTVGVMINGAGPFRFLVDTGADRTVIGAGLAQRLALRRDQIVTLHDMATTRQVETVWIDSLRVGPAEFSGISAPVLLERDLGAEGILGIDALREQRLSMDFVLKTMTVQDPRRPEPARLVGDEIVVTARRRKGQLIITQVQIGRNRLEAVIDSGAQVTLGNGELRRVLFGRRNARQPVRVTLFSVTGEPIEAEMLQIPEMRVGGLILRNLSIAFADVPPFALFGLDRRPAILLGSDVLTAFRRVSMDFRQRKIRFVLR